MSQQYEEAERQIMRLAFANRENNIRHHYYDEEMKQYQMLQAGDSTAVDESAHMMTSELHGNLSDDPLRNVKYLFVANITLATRFAIEGGMDSETAYNISDVYIQKMDKCVTIEEVMAVHREMYTYFTKRMTQLEKEKVISRAVLRCIDYINENLHSTIRVADLAEHVQLNASYLSELFKKEMNIPISHYVLKRKIETAKNMLLHSEFTSAEISDYLAFSSQSYFIRAFKKLTGMTPLEYQKKYFNRGIRAASVNLEKK